MASVTRTPFPDQSTTAAEFTADDLTARFGPIPLRRIVTDPAPGMATEQDIFSHQRRTGRCCELIDGILVEKDMSWETSVVAMEIARLIGNFLYAHRLGGQIGGEAGLLRLPIGGVRIPDVSYVAADRLPPALREPIPNLVPNLAVEVLSPGNTRREMEEKLDDYFASGVELVWLVDLRSRTVRIFTSRDAEQILAEEETLDGGSVLPGFSVQIAHLFNPPTG